MIEIPLGPEDILRLRFASSPMMEVVTSYRILLGKKGVARAYQHWCEHAHHALNDLDLPYMHEVMGCKWYIPDFLTPVPQTPAPDLETQMQRIMATPDSEVRQHIAFQIEVAGSSAVRQQFLSHPHEALTTLLDEVRDYWQRVLLDHWPRVQAAFEGDVLYRARRQALQGIGHVFTDLHPQVEYTGNAVKLEHMHVHAEETLPTNGGLVLIPTYFAGPAVYWQGSLDAPPMLAYTPRGIGMWTTTPEVHNDDALEIVIGAGRARVLQELAAPANTGELAHRLAITSGAVSQHLSRLQQAGLVRPHRSGKRVYYHLTQRGQDLLHVFART